MSLRKLWLSTAVAVCASSLAVAQISGGGGGTPSGGGPTSASLNAGPISNTPTVTNAAYSANNAIGGLQTVAVFRTTGQPSGILAQIGLSSKGGLTATEAVYAFTKSPASTCTDKAAFVLSSADLPFLVPGFPVSLTPATTAGTTQTTSSVVVNEPVKNADSSATTNLYFCAVTTGTPTPASTTDLVFTYTILQD